MFSTSVVIYINKMFEKKKIFSGLPNKNTTLFTKSYSKKLSARPSYQTLTQHQNVFFFFFLVKASWSGRELFNISSFVYAPDYTYIHIYPLHTHMCLCLRTKKKNYLFKNTLNDNKYNTFFIRYLTCRNFIGHEFLSFTHFDTRPPQHIAKLSG